MGNIRGTRDCWNGAVRLGRDFRPHRLVGNRRRYGRIARSYVSRSDDVASMRIISSEAILEAELDLSMRLCHAKELVACALDRLDVVHAAAIPLRAEPAATRCGEMVE
jgi:hypothetical protein